MPSTGELHPRTESLPPPAVSGGKVFTQTTTTQPTPGTNTVTTAATTKHHSSGKNAHARFSRHLRPNRRRLRPHRNQRQRSTTPHQQGRERVFRAAEERRRPGGSHHQMPAAAQRPAPPAEATAVARRPEPPEEVDDVTAAALRPAPPSKAPRRGPVGAAPAGDRQEEGGDGMTGEGPERHGEGRIRPLGDQIERRRPKQGTGGRRDDDGVVGWGSERGRKEAKAGSPADGRPTRATRGPSGRATSRRGDTGPEGVPRSCRLRKAAHHHRAPRRATPPPPPHALARRRRSSAQSSAQI